MKLKFVGCIKVQLIRILLNEAFTNLSATHIVNGAYNAPRSEIY